MLTPIRARGAKTPAPAADARARRAPSLRERAYEAIKHRITTCQYRPGEYLNEVGVAKALKLGRTPVHQALTRLMLEGMLDVLPRKGAIVKAISLDEVQEIIQVRLTNEGFCARLAAQRASERDVAELADVVERSRSAAADGDIERLMLLDREFHRALARSARNSVLAQILGQLHDRSLRFWFVSLTDRDHHLSVIDEHRGIAEAVRAHDPDAAEAAIRAHIQSFQQSITRQV